MTSHLFPSHILAYDAVPCYTIPSRTRPYQAIRRLQHAHSQADMFTSSTVSLPLATTVFFLQKLSRVLFYRIDHERNDSSPLSPLPEITILIKTFPHFPRKPYGLPGPP
ncbi:hypothetical protein QCA50_004622 [Cerrena zonata]|uniref:Uncharacterized protein n=1 Tax=Cerrena zonata TaxID=2478898 RepID=A0AAW0GK24_9APHY